MWYSDTMMAPKTKKNPAVVQVPEFPTAQYPALSLGDRIGCRPKKIEFSSKAMFSMKIYRWYVESSFGTDIRTTTIVAKTDKNDVMT